MKTLRSLNHFPSTAFIFPLIAFIFAFAFAGPVSAQYDGTVEIENDSGEKRKICAYRGHGAINIIATRCFTMNDGEKVLWTRENPWELFKVKIFESRPLLDKYLYSRNLPVETAAIIIGEGGKFGYSTHERKPALVKYRLKVCNSQFDDPVWFTLGFDTNDTFFTRGWWNVKKGDCIDVAVSELMYKDKNVPYGTLPRTYYYARTYGEKGVEWVGGEDGTKLCINTTSVFRIDQIIPKGNGLRDKEPCDGVDEAIKSFRTVNAPKSNEEYYYLSF
ncbi:MAG TPA: DUF1036 domain-containing protein [Aridibacter sp.]|nr:DUF1036 domain-containing protein [Aridibacter sp.]